jgi:hypothetical protein
MMVHIGRGGGGPPPRPPRLSRSGPYGRSGRAFRTSTEDGLSRVPRRLTQFAVCCPVAGGVWFAAG